MSVHETVWLAILASLSWVTPVAALAWVLGLVAHGLGRPTWPASAVMVGAFGFVLGIPLTFGLGLFDRSIPDAVILVMIGAIVVATTAVVVQAIRGRLRSAGVLLATTALPTLAYLGTALVEAIVGGLDASLTLVAVVVLASLAMVVGLGLAVHGDARPMPDPMAPAGRPGSHRATSLTRTLFAAARYGPLPTTEVVPALGVVVVIVVLGMDAPLLLPASVAGGLAGAVLGAELEVRWMPRDVRLALEGLHTIGLGALAYFRNVTGRDAPGRPADVHAWLATPPTDADRRFRSEFLAAYGRIDEARSVALGLPDGTPDEAVWKEQALAEVAYRAGARFDAARVLAVIEHVVDPDTRLVAEGQVTWGQAEQALADESRGWMRPLLAYRAGLPAGTAGLHARTWRRRALLPAAITGVVAGIVLPETARLLAAISGRG
jgi:hypothetical protein